MGDEDYEVDFETRNTFLHVTVRPASAPLMARSRSWTPSTSSNHSSEQSVPAGWLPATLSPAAVEVVEMGREPTGPQTALHQVFTLPSGTSSSSKESSEQTSQSILSENKLREVVAAFREGGECREVEEEYEQYELPSLGSAGHFDGTCQPCRFIHLSDGCRNGFNCNFCHEEHEAQGGKTHRPSKGIRSGFKRTVNQIVESDMPEEEKMEAYQRLAERSPYMRCLLKAVVPNIDELVKARGQGTSSASVGGPSNASGSQLPAAPPLVPRIPGLQPPEGDGSPTKITL